ALTSELFQLLPWNLGDTSNPTAAAKRRGLVTVRSFDVDRPGVVPYVFDPAAPPYGAGPTTDPNQPAIPKAQPSTFPTVVPPPRPTVPANSEFGQDYRSLIAALEKVDLNRPLAPYPHQGSGRRPPFGRPLTVETSRNLVDAFGRFDTDPPNPQIDQQFRWAQQDRQTLANDIYRRLVAVPGVPLPVPRNPPDDADEAFRARRWLAQLAVNIVDFIDEDDISTPFNFYTHEDAGVAEGDFNFGDHLENFGDS